MNHRYRERGTQSSGVLQKMLLTQTSCKQAALEGVSHFYNTLVVDYR